MPAAITIRSPSRLHFGLMNFGGTGRQFGGIGMMIDRPGVVLRVTSTSAFSTTGPLAERVAIFARRWQAYHGCEGELQCQIEVLDAPREHTGLGVGTQLAMSVAMGLGRFFAMPQQMPAELATSVGRGQRSAVGAYGFIMGGLVAERGKLPGERFSPLDAQLDLPDAWRIVLFCPRETSGLASADEVKAFSTLPPVPSAVSEELARLAREELLPAAAQGRFERFADSVYEYGRLSGNCFAALQGGPYNGPRLTALVDQLRALGVRGVGQSSWGPTIFALAPSAQEAAKLVEAMRGKHDLTDVDITIAGVSHHGAQTELMD